MIDFVEGHTYVYKPCPDKCNVLNDRYPVGFLLTCTNIDDRSVHRVTGTLGVHFSWVELKFKYFKVKSKNKDGYFVADLSSKEKNGRRR